MSHAEAIARRSSFFFLHVSQSIISLVFPSSCSTKGCTPSASSVTRWWRRGPTHHQPATLARPTIVLDGLTQLALFIVNKILLFPDCPFCFTNKCCHPVHNCNFSFLWKSKSVFYIGKYWTDGQITVNHLQQQSAGTAFATRLLLLKQLWWIYFTMFENEMVLGSECMKFVYKVAASCFISWCSLSFPLQTRLGVPVHCRHLQTRLTSVSQLTCFGSRERCGLAATRGRHEWILLNVPDSITPIDGIMRFFERPQEGAKCSKNGRGIEFPLRKLNVFIRKVF